MRYLWITLFVLASSCSNTDTEVTTTNKIDTTTQTSSSVNRMDTACYLAVQNRDSILLQLYTNDSTVTGLMQYDNFEIDGNIGTVQAIRHDNRIEGYFRFFAEGMWSVREIIFEEQGNQLRQAQTDNMIYSGDTARFQNKEDVLFEQQRVFQKWDCGQLHFDALPQ